MTLDENLQGILGLIFINDAGVECNVCSQDDYRFADVGDFCGWSAAAVKHIEKYHLDELPTFVEEPSPPRTLDEVRAFLNAS